MATIPGQSSSSPIIIHDDISPSLSSKKLNWWTRQALSYEKIARVENWINLDGSVFPVSPESLCKFIRFKSRTNNPQSVDWYVNGLMKYQFELGFENPDRVKYHPDVTTTRTRMREDYKAMVSEKGGDPKKLKKMRKFEKKRALSSQEHLHSPNSYRIPSHYNVNNNNNNNNSNNNNIYSNNISSREVYLQPHLDQVYPIYDEYEPLYLENEECPARAVLIYLGCWTVLEELEFQIEFQNPRQQQQQQQHTMILSQGSGVWFRRSEDLQDEENYNDGVTFPIESYSVPQKLREPLVTTASQVFNTETPMKTAMSYEIPKKREQSFQDEQRPSKSIKLSRTGEGFEHHERFIPTGFFQNSPSTFHANVTALKENESFKEESGKPIHTSIASMYPEPYVRIEIGEHHHLTLTDKTSQY
ncbi:hypothetical protein G9A89_002321 [Geosiphon pyriformis]|nr:hypothetical protein G9A89_002321 [Geosiphon pyriformis]